MPPEAAARSVVTSRVRPTTCSTFDPARRQRATAVQAPGYDQATVQTGAVMLIQRLERALNLNCALAFISRDDYAPPMPSRAYS